MPDVHVKATVCMVILGAPFSVNSIILLALYWSPTGPSVFTRGDISALGSLGYNFIRI